MNHQQNESSNTDDSESENKIYESESSDDLNDLNNVNNNNNISDIDLIKLVDLKLKYEGDTLKLENHLKIIKSKMDEINKQLIHLMKTRSDSYKY